MAGAAVEALLDTLFADEARMGLSLALHAVAGDGTVLAERYGPTAGPDVPLISWSMAKSVTHLAVGVLVGEGRLAVDQADLFPPWAEDERASITVEHLLRMQDGLEFNEDYVDGQTSNTIEMLFGAGADDIVAYAAARPLAAAPGTRWSYSSGTTNLLADVARRAAGVAPGAAWQDWLERRVLAPSGLGGADARLDAAGSWVASSYLYATAPQFAAFGLTYLHGGAGVVDPSWVEHAATPTPGVNEPDRGYGAQWWLRPDRPDWIVAQGYETQRIIVDRARDLVVVRLGKTPQDVGGTHVDALLCDLIDAL